MSKPYMCGDEIPVYIPEGGCDCNYTIKYIESEDYAAIYHLMLNGEQVGDPIEIPLDDYIVEGHFLTVIEHDVPYDGAEVGDSYIKLIRRLGGIIYIPMDDLLANYYNKTQIDAIVDSITTGDLGYPVGSVYVTNTATNPSSTLVGNWSLIDKSLRQVALTGSDTNISWNASAAEEIASLILRWGTSIYVRLQWKSKADYADTNVTVCSIPKASLGLVDVPYESYTIAQSDGGNGVAMVQFTQNSPNLDVVIHDVVSHNAASGTIPSGSNFALSELLIFTKAHVDNSACDLFYWKRTS